MVEAQVNRHEVVPDLIQIPQLETHQVHWERTVRDTPETVEAAEPEAEEPMEAKVDQEPREMLEVSEDIQDQT